MGNRPELLTLIVNVILIAFLLINVIRCGYKGFLLSLWECFGTIFALLIAWNVSPIIGNIIMIYPKAWTPMTDTLLGPMFQASLNRFAWALIIFIAIKLILWMMKPIIKMIQSIPIIKQLNQVAGALFGAVITWIWAMIAVIILSVPIFAEGQMILNTTLLGPVRSFSMEMFDTMGEVIAENETLARLFSGQALTAEDQKVLEKWLQEYHLDEESLREFFN